MGKNKAARQLRTAMRSARSADVSSKKIAKGCNAKHREDLDHYISVKSKVMNRKILRDLREIEPLEGPKDVAYRLYVREDICEKRKG